jgi:peptidoglycan hydrolase CwlO-like protein
MTIAKLWENYLLLPIWKKFLLAIPLLLTILALFVLYMFFKNPQTNERVVQFSKEKTDNEVKEYELTEANILEEVKVIDLQRKELKEELNDNEKEHIEFSNRINSATSSDELTRIAADLRASAAARKLKVSAGS